MAEEEQKTDTPKSELKENLVVVAKVGGFMIFLAILGFIFLLIVLMNWMANP